MVTPAAFARLAATAADAALPPSGPIPKALREGNYPWYNPGAGRVRPVLSSPDFGSGFWKSLGDTLQGIGQWIAGIFRWLNFWRIPGIGGLGDVVGVGLALLLLAVVLALLVELLRRYHTPDDEAPADAGLRPGGARRIEGLPAGVRADVADPWAEAQRLRSLGDYSGAVIYLFAHQLLSLERARLVRLVPGRTGRQLVRSVADRKARDAVGPTLRLFEQVYYGRRAPTADAFDAVWSRALGFNIPPAAPGASS